MRAAPFDDSVHAAAVRDLAGEHREEHRLHGVSDLDSGSVSNDRLDLYGRARPIRIRGDHGRREHGIWKDVRTYAGGRRKAALRPRLTSGLPTAADAGGEHQ